MATASNFVQHDYLHDNTANTDSDKETSQLKTFIELSTLINSSLDISEVREKAIQAANSLVGCEASSLLFVNPETGGLYFDVATGESSEQLKRIQLKRGEGIAGWVAERREVLVIDDAQNDPRRYKDADKKSGFITKNMLCVPIATKNNTLGVLQAINKKETNHFEDADVALLQALAHQIAIALENAKLHQQLKESLYSVIQVLVETIEKRDPNAAGHAKRVSNYSLIIGKALGLRKQQLVSLKLAATLHDIGMIAIPDEIVQKKTRLLDAELSSIMSHMVQGEEILTNVKHLQHIRKYIRYHHEHFDGTGPFRLKGEDIPLISRIIAVADTFDGLTNQRPYQQTKGYDAAMEEIRKLSGTVLDPNVVNAFFASDASMAARKHPLIARRTYL